MNWEQAWLLQPGWKLSNMNHIWILYNIMNHIDISPPIHNKKIKTSSIKSLPLIWELLQSRRTRSPFRRPPHPAAPIPPWLQLQLFPRSPSQPGGHDTTSRRGAPFNAAGLLLQRRDSSLQIVGWSWMITLKFCEDYSNYNDGYIKHYHVQQWWWLQLRTITAISASMMASKCFKHAEITEPDRPLQSQS